MESYNLILVAVLIIISLGISFYSYWQTRKFKESLKKREEEMQQKMYELAILKELGDRIGYSLNIEKIADVITGSLHQFISYSAVSYMLLKPEKIVFKVHLEKSVSRRFVDDVRSRMLGSLSALLNKEFKKSDVDEVMSGSILVEEVKDPVRSFFNIPLVIGDKAVGVLTVAHTQEGLYKENEMTILYKITQQASQAVSRLQDVIQTEQGKLNAMVRSITEGIVMTDKDYRIVVVNPAAKKAVGIEKYDEITIFDFIDNLEGKFDIRGKLEESVRLDKILVTDEVLIKKKYFQIFVSPVKKFFGLDKSEILGGVVIFHDITYGKELEQMREDFSNMMVHELRSPLDGINKMSEVIQNKIKKKTNKVSLSSFKEYVDMIHGNSSRILSLVNDMLDVAKMESGKFEIIKRPMNLREILNERKLFYQVKAEAENKLIEVVVGENLPERVVADPFRIVQVLDNLLSNALKFTKNGDSIKIFALNCEDEDDFQKIFFNHPELKHLNRISPNDLSQNFIIAGVADTGRGIPKNMQGKLFNKFIQAVNRGEVQAARGTGLGLVIVKGIVESHGGKAGVVSEEGEGSVFYFIMPINN